MPPASARTIARGRDAHGEQNGRHRDRQEELDAVEDAPAHRAEDPFPDPQRQADDEEEDGEDDERDGQRAERRDPADLARDRARFGLGQVDVGDDERHERIAGGAELGAESRRRLARAARALRGGGGVDGGGGGGVDGVELSAGSSRIVLQLSVASGGQPR